MTSNCETSAQSIARLLFRDRTLSILQQLTEMPLAEIKYYHFREGQVDGVTSIISRTGYTGEDGFEVYAAADKAEQLWNKMLDAGNFGSAEGRAPLRSGRPKHAAARSRHVLSMVMRLMKTTTLLEANLGWICKLNKGDFIGRERTGATKGRRRQAALVGFEMTDRGIARDGQDVFIEGQQRRHGYFRKPGTISEEEHWHGLRSS